MGLSDSCTEDMSQKSGLSADFPISIASSPASPVSSCDTLLDQGADELAVNTDQGSESMGLPDSSSSNVGDTATILSAESEDHLRALMAKYERVIYGESEQSQPSSSEIPTNRDDEAILPDCHRDDDRDVDEPTQMTAPYRKRTPRKTRRGKQSQSSSSPSRVQKKSASVQSNQAYTFLRLGGARRAANSVIECEVYWTPTWLPIDRLEGNDAIKEAKDWVVELFGPDAWQEETRKLGLMQ